MIPNPNNPHSTTWLILLVLMFGLLITGVVFLLSHQSKKSGEAIPPSPTPTIRSVSPTAAISRDEQQQVMQWIKENDLNEYADPKDTVYTGGTPLFDETTGKTIDLYDYILQNHPDRPWKN